MEMTAMKNIENKENYEIPEVSVVEFKTEDVLTVSGGCGVSRGLFPGEMLKEP